MNTANTQSRELLLQILSDRHICEGQVVDALSSSGSYGPRDPETIEKRKKYFRQRMPTATSDVIEDYLARNAERLPINEIYGTVEALDVRSDEELGAIFSDSKNGWKTFRQRFPRSQGTLRISCAGFSSDGTQGMICIGQQVDWLAGHGVCYLYVKTESGWTKKHEVMVWIS
jgi:hypothetical protein